MTTPGRRRRLGEVLVEQQVITEDQLKQALDLQGQAGPGQRRRRLGTVIIDAGFATERQIAELVVQGRTNREVADALFVSVHTVEANLKRIYRKLGIRSRTELASTFPSLPSGS